MTLGSDDNKTIDATTVFGPQRDPLYIVLPITMIYILIFVTGIFGNTVTCIVIIRNKIMHTATNYYLFSLAISDLVLLVTGMPSEIYSIWSKWPYVFGSTFCVARSIASETSTNASVLTITLFTIERYLAICHPFVSHKMSKLSRAVKHVMLVWVLSFVLALPQALQFGIRVHRGVAMCLQTRVIFEHSFEISTFLFFFAPMIIITVLYSLIGLRLKKTNKNKDAQKNEDFEINIRFSSSIRRQNTQPSGKVIKMLVAVVVAFFICWAPFHAQRLVYIYGTSEDHLALSPVLHIVYSTLTYISGVFYYMSTCINPIFYHMMSNKFREAFKTTMKQCCCRHSERHRTVQHCSYTAIALARNPNFNRSSGHSTRHDAPSQTKFMRLDSKEINQNNGRTGHNYPGSELCNDTTAPATLPKTCDYKYTNNQLSTANGKSLHQVIDNNPLELTRMDNFIEMTANSEENKKSLSCSSGQESPRCEIFRPPTTDEIRSCCEENGTAHKSKKDNKL